MNKADVQFKKAIETVLEEGVMDVDPRPYWLEEDGSYTSTFIIYNTIC